MYERKGTVYADPYKLLKGQSSVRFQAVGELSDFEEIDAPTDDLTVVGGYASWAGGNCRQAIAPAKGYAHYKERLVKRRYSNDDQLAVILNKEDGEDGRLEYERMQAWREWAADVAKKITELANEV